MGTWFGRGARGSDRPALRPGEGVSLDFGRGLGTPCTVERVRYDEPDGASRIYVVRVEGFRSRSILKVPAGSRAGVRAEAFGRLALPITSTLAARPALCSLPDSGCEIGLIYEEFLGDAEESARIDGPWDDAEVAFGMYPAVLVLAILHEAGLLHGDVKPRNLFLHPDRLPIGPGGRPIRLLCLGDFETVRPSRESEVRFPQGVQPRVGMTPEYAPPSGRTEDPEYDLHCLGLTLLDISRTGPSSPRTAGVASRCLEGSLARFRSAREVLAAFDDLAASVGAEASPGQLFAPDDPRGDCPELVMEVLENIARLTSAGLGSGAGTFLRAVGRRFGSPMWTFAGRALCALWDRDREAIGDVLAVAPAPDPAGGAASRACLALEAALAATAGAVPRPAALPFAPSGIPPLSEVSPAALLPLLDFIAFAPAGAPPTRRAEVAWSGSRGLGQYADAALGEWSVAFRCMRGFQDIARIDRPAVVEDAARMAALHPLFAACLLPAEWLEGIAVLVGRDALVVRVLDSYQEAAMRGPARWTALRRVAALMPALLAGGAETFAKAGDLVGLGGDVLARAVDAMGPAPDLPPCAVPWLLEWPALLAAMEDPS
ncbi:MAG: hypothetical protein FJ087_18550 [Deltaproteobacteria bacterium]|nr:hypothetical protein [Deltaproteobacteria bacterium]